MNGESIEREQPLYFNWNEGSAVRTNRWELIRWGTEWELYDMQADRTETDNLTGEHPEIVEQLKSQWNE